MLASKHGEHMIALHVLGYRKMFKIDLVDRIANIRKSLMLVASASTQKASVQKFHTCSFNACRQ